jgi:prevent-host-death family protein
MVAYTQQELVGSTELAKSLGGFIDKVVNRTVEKIAIVRHNKPEAVIVPIADFERNAEAAAFLEMLEIISIIEDRDPNGNREGSFDFDAYHQKRKANVQG